MDKHLEELVIFYRVTDVDWLGFKITRKNKLTYHHLVKVSLGGKKTFENGVPLTKVAHMLINLASEKDPILYMRCQLFFKEIINNGKYADTHRAKARVLRKDLELL